MTPIKDLKEVKRDVHKCCLALLKDKLVPIQNDLQLLQEAQKNETKSSMGDKYETGPAMLHQQRERLLQQESQIVAHQSALQQLDPQKECKVVQPGCLLQTDKGKFYFSIGLGAISCGGEQVWVISMQSPLGIQFNQQKVGSKVSFQGRQYLIEQLT